jgi:type 1 glutamine amidotransferase
MLPDDSRSAIDFRDRSNIVCENSPRNSSPLHEVPTMNSPQFVRSHALFTCLALLLAAIITLPRPLEAATAPKKTPRVLFLISEDPDNYKAHETMPRFAKTLERTKDFRVSVIKGEGELTAFRFPGLLPALAEADVVVFFSRRIALPHEQLDAIKAYLKQGKPLVALRTANHGFAPRGKVAEGYAAWPEFVPEILGCENRGYGPAQAGTDVAQVPAAANHPILKGVPAKWHSAGNVYHVAPLLDTSATVLLTGTIPGKVEPVAWTRMAGRSRVFYTSLAHPSDFETPSVPTMLTNGIRWALGLENK